MEPTSELLMQLAIYQYKYIKNYYITKNVIFKDLKEYKSNKAWIDHNKLTKLNNLATHNLHSDEKQLVYTHYHRNDMILLWYDFSLNVLDLEVKEYQYFYDTEYIQMLCEIYTKDIHENINFLAVKQKAGMLKIQKDFSIKHIQEYEGSKKDKELLTAEDNRTSYYVKRDKNILTFFLIILDILEIWDEHNHFEKMDQNDPEEIYKFFDKYFATDYTLQHEIYLYDYEKESHEK